MRCAFIADTGTGCDFQKSVGKGLSKLIKQSKIKFVLLGGDNFYPDGCAGKDDSLFTSHFEIPYKSISNDIKFFGCLGNHDIHHPNGHNAQFDYSEHSIENDMKFVLPNHFYDFGHKDLFQIFIFLYLQQIYLYSIPLSITTYQATYVSLLHPPSLLSQRENTNICQIIIQNALYNVHSKLPDKKRSLPNMVIQSSSLSLSIENNHQ